MPKVFFDTNILGYAVDAFDQRKQKIGLRLLEERRFSETATLSTQVFQKFYVVATKKLRVSEVPVKSMVEINGLVIRNPFAQ